jgi:hypothetical protein
VSAFIPGPQMSILRALANGTDRAAAMDHASRQALVRRGLITENAPNPFPNYTLTSAGRTALAERDGPADSTWFNL